MIGDVAAGSPVSGDALTIVHIRGGDAAAPLSTRWSLVRRKRPTDRMWIEQSQLEHSRPRR